MNRYEKRLSCHLSIYFEKKIQEGKDKFIILPMGEWGKLGRNILCKNGLKPFLCLDNIEYNMKDVLPISFLNKKEDIEECQVVILTIHKEIEKSLINQISEIIDKDKIITTSELMDECFEDIINFENKVKLDFLCIGFIKCGTSSLDKFLRANQNIGLPSVKETQYINRMGSVSHNVFCKFYTNEQIRRSKVGGIEPAYAMMPHRVSTYFGKDIKLIFCLRNPVEALFSCFKMCLRECSVDEVPYLYEKYGHPSLDMFKDFFENYKEQFCYFNYIEEWISYYNKEQMMFVIFEEMIRESNRVMYDIQEFIGLKEDEIIFCEEFPCVNEGSMVAKDGVCAKIHNVISQKRTEYHFLDISEEEKNRVELVFKDILIQTQMKYTEKLTEELIEELLEYYMPSIQSLEKLLDRSLKGIWY